MTNAKRELEKVIEPIFVRTMSAKGIKELAQAILDAGFVKLEDGLSCPRCGRIFHDEDVKKSPDDYFTCPTCSTIQHKKCMGVIGEVYVRLEDVGIDEKKIRDALQAMLVIGWERGKNNLPIDKETSLYAESRATTVCQAKGIIKVKEGK